MEKISISKLVYLKFQLLSESLEIEIFKTREFVFLLGV